MIPIGYETVTLIRRVETKDSGNRTHVSYTAHTLTGCSWMTARSWTRMDTATENTAQVTCRVPSGQQRPQPGDVLVNGTATAPADTAGLQQMLENGAIRILTVRDNARPGMPMPHYACIGG